jgi:hypothetical protein
MIEMKTFDPVVENRLRKIEEHVLLKRRISDTEPEGIDRQVTLKQRLRQ